MDSTIPETIPQPTTKKSRLPRYARVQSPPRMVLTERDREILRQIYMFRLITREQIERMLFLPTNGQDHFTKTSRARLRLKLLYQHGFLERIPTPVGQGSWAWRPVYRMARKGAVIIAQELGTSVTELQYWGRGDDQDHRHLIVGFLFLDHILKINDVRIAFIQATNKQGYRIEKWLSDWQLKSQVMKDYVSVAHDGRRSVKVAVIPDAYFALHLGNRRAHFFLELDQATMSNNRWKRRVEAYLAYVRSGQYQERYQTTSLRILTVTTTLERMINLKRTTAKAGGKELFWFTTLDQVQADTVISSPIWLLANDETDRSRKTLVS